MKKIKNYVFLSLLIASFLVQSFAHGMMFSKATKLAMRHSRKIAAAAVVGAGVLALKKDEDKIRLAALRSNRFFGWDKKMPKFFAEHATNPLLLKTHYTDFYEYLNEADDKTLKRQKIAKTLSDNNISLDLSQTEADILTYPEFSWREEERHLGDSSDSTRKKLIKLKKDLTLIIINEMASAEQLPVDQAKEVIAKIFAIEKKISGEDKTILYHSMPPLYYAANYLGTQLDELATGVTIPKDFLKLRQPFQHQELNFWQRLSYWWHFGVTESNIREKLMSRKAEDGSEVAPMMLMKGSFNSESVRDNNWDTRSDINSDLSRVLVACNSSLVGNAMEPGDSSLNYMSFNKMIYDKEIIKFDSEELCKVYGISKDIIEKHKERLQYIVDKFCENSPTSVLLQIELPSALMKEVAYPALSYGTKLKLRISDTQETISSSSELMKLIRTNPFSIRNNYLGKRNDGIDYLQFRLIADKTCLLDTKNPTITNNVKIKAFAVKEERLQKFQRDIDHIIAQMRQEMQGSKQN